MNKPVYRMSGAGNCPRKLSASRLGYEPTPAPGWLASSALEGKWHEERLVKELEEEGMTIFDRQLEITLDYPNFQLVGHIDGKVTGGQLNDDKIKLFEAKSMSQFEFDRWMRGGFDEFPNYLDQATCYMEACRLQQCFYVVKNRNNGYVNRRFISLMQGHMDSMASNIAEVETSVSKGELFPVEFNPNSLECKRCNYKQLCVPELKELTAVENEDLKLATDEWRDGKALVEEGQALIDSAKLLFEMHTRVTNIFKWRYLGLAIQLVEYKEAKTYPKAKLLEVFTEEQLEPASEVKAAFDQLRVNDLQKGENNE